MWGLVGILDLDLVATLFGDMTMLTRIVYGLVGICGLINIGILFSHIEQLCTIIVTIAPATTPKIGFDNFNKISDNIGKLLNPLAISTIVIIPVNDKPSPILISIIKLFAGVALLIYGMKILSANLKKISGGKLEKFLVSATANMFKGVLTGILITVRLHTNLC